MGLLSLIYSAVVVGLLMLLLPLSSSSRAISFQGIFNLGRLRHSGFVCVCASLLCVCVGLVFFRLHLIGLEVETRQRPECG